MQFHEIPWEERSVTDQQIFDAFSLGLPELTPVKSALEAGDTAMAKVLLIRHMEKRSCPFYLYDYRSLPLQSMDTDSCPYSFQSSLGLGGSLKEFCLYAARQMMNHIYVLPGADRREVDLGRNWENMIHFNIYEDTGKKHRNYLDMMVRGQFFESLCVLYHETGDREVLTFFEEILGVFFDTYPLTVVHGEPSTSRFQYTEDRDVMSVGWLALVYISLFYTRIPYEISPDASFEILKRIWFLGIQFARFEKDDYRPYNHHLWERGLVPFLLGVMFPEIPDFAAMKVWGAPVVCRHLKEDFNIHGGYSEHSIAYWSGAAVGEMLYRGIALAKLNKTPLLDEEAAGRMEKTFHILAMLCPPGRHYPSLGDNGGPLADPILALGIRMTGHPECRQILEIRQGKDADKNRQKQEDPALDYCNDRSGFACAKSGYGPKSSYMLMSVKTDCGFCGHNHMDMLSLFFTLRGEEIIGEPYAGQMYHRVKMASDIRGYQYNMTGHNTVLAYGAPIAPNRMYANKWGVMRPSSPVVESFSHPDGFYVSAFHDGYTFCRHQRDVLFHRSKGLIVSDHIMRGNRLEDPHIQRWHLMPGTKVISQGADYLIVEKNGVRLLFLWAGAEHKISLSKADFLIPDILSEKEVLPDVIDASFHASPRQKQENATISLRLLLLDITGHEVEEKTVKALAGGSDLMSRKLNTPEALEAFGKVKIPERSAL